MKSFISEDDIEQDKLDKAKERLSGILDKSILSQNSNDPDSTSKADYLIHEYKVIDLSKINVEDLRKELRLIWLETLKMVLL